MVRITYAEENGLLVEIRETPKADSIDFDIRCLNTMRDGAIEALREPVLEQGGRCDCACRDFCPLGKTGSEKRCMREELEKAGVFLRRKDS